MNSETVHVAKRGVFRSLWLVKPYSAPPFDLLWEQHSRNGYRRFTGNPCRRGYRSIDRIVFQLFIDIPMDLKVPTSTIDDEAPLPVATYPFRELKSKTIRPNKGRSERFLNDSRPTRANIHLLDHTRVAIRITGGISLPHTGNDIGCRQIVRETRLCRTGSLTQQKQQDNENCPAGGIAMCYGSAVHGGYTDPYAFRAP